MRYKDWFSNLALGIAAASALAMTGMAVHDEMRSSGSPPHTVVRSDPISFDRWSDVVQFGQRIGPPTAPITVVEFGDFECPACSGFEELTLKPIMRAHAGDIKLIYHHLPLPFHRFAYPAARASECAAAQGRFSEFHDLLFARHDSLGLKSFHEFAKSAGLTNLDSFDRCNNVQSKVAAVERDMALAHNLGFRATPMVLINGSLWPTTPDSEAMEREIAKVLSEVRK